MTNADQTSAGGVPRHHIFHQALVNSGIYGLVDRLLNRQEGSHQPFPSCLNSIYFRM